AVGVGRRAGLRAPWMLLLGMAVLWMGYGFASPTVASLISKLREQHLQGEALGLNLSAPSIARIVGPIAGGLLYAAGPAAPYVGGAMVWLVAFILACGVDWGS